MFVLAACQPAGNESAAATTEASPAGPTATATILVTLTRPFTLTPSPPPPSPTVTMPPPSATLPPTPEATATATTIPTPSATPDYPNVNGIPIENIVVLPEAVQDNVQAIFARGQALGRNPAYYSKLGDSTVMTPHMLARFDEPNLNLGAYDYLQPTVDHFSGVFAEFGVAANYGLHSWSIFDPFWASEEWCNAEEHILECEFRLNNPAFLIIRLGSNDSGSPDGFRYNIRQAAQYAIDNGVVPILMTKADRFEGDNTNNEILRELAAELQIPLWDFDIVAETLPGRGLDTDSIHFPYYTDNDYSDPAAFQSGHAVQDLTGLMMLDALLQVVGS